MGQCYSVDMRLVYKDRNAANRALVGYINKNKEAVNFNIPHLAKKGVSLYGGIVDAIKLLITNCEFESETSPEEDIFRSSFEGSYGWSDVMEEGFKAMVPFLKDGSELTIFPDMGYDKFSLDCGVVNYYGQEEEPNPCIDSKEEMEDHLESKGALYNTKSGDYLMYNECGRYLHYRFDRCVAKKIAEWSRRYDEEDWTFCPEIPDAISSIKDPEYLDTFFPSDGTGPDPEEWLIANTNTIDFI